MYDWGYYSMTGDIIVYDWGYKCMTGDMSV